MSTTQQASALPVVPAGQVQAEAKAALMEQVVDSFVVAARFALGCKHENGICRHCRALLSEALQAARLAGVEVEP